ncbi:hypothetical protein EW145_g8259, partial [Phellinidium pouzarii]
MYTRLPRRKAAWVAFCIVVLATLAVVVSASASDDVSGNGDGDGDMDGAVAVPSTETGALTDTATSSLTHGGVVSDLKYAESGTTPSHNSLAEANRAYKQALLALSTIPSYPPLSNSGLLDSYQPQQQQQQILPNSIFTTLFPNQQGPIASIIRIAFKLRGSGGGGAWRKAEEMKGKALKVIDLLEHAAELGHMDALYKLAFISLFHPSPLLHAPARAHSAYHTHASLTGNATSNAMLAFFHATGYAGAVSIDQAQALLYYTFAALGGDRGAQMALGYRYWAGVGVNDECGAALEWYQMAAEQSMAKFISGPPGGRTLLHTTTRLSDLNGGAYGPGASVASTGMNAHRAVVKAASARQAGETWEDVLEYYMFNADRGEIDFAYRLGKIFYQGSIYAVQGGAASGGE